MCTDRIIWPELPWRRHRRGRFCIASYPDAGGGAPRSLRRRRCMIAE
jgi:hypothetical protein